MVKILSSANLLICLLSGISANFLQSALNIQQTKDSFQKTLSKNDNFPEYPNCGIAKTSIANNRIYGGDQVEPHALPWMVYFTKKCGGTFINSRWVLTAAHCFYEPIKGFIFYDKAFINAIDCDAEKGTCDSNAREVEISKRIVHPGYNTSVLYHDIALIQLKEEVEFSDKIQPICLPYNNEVIGSNIFNKEAHVSGWGYTENKRPSKHLLKVAVNVWDADKCEKMKIGLAPIDRLLQICAGGVAGKDACQGDSGGPLYMQLPLAAGSNTKKAYYQVGIVSLGELCGLEGNPGVYTNVSTYIPWIRETILSNS